MDGLGGDHAVHGGSVTDLDVATRQHAGINTAHGAEAEIAVLGDLGDHKADLVHVCGQHQAAGVLCVVVHTTAADLGDEVARAIHAALVIRALDLLRDKLSYRLLATRRAKEGGQLLEQLQSIMLHCRTPPRSPWI